MPDHFLRVWREARRWTQADLAEAIDMSEVSISRIETGKQALTDRARARAAKALGIAPAALYSPPPAGTRPLDTAEAGQAGGIHVAWPDRVPVFAMIDVPGRHHRLSPATITTCPAPPAMTSAAGLFGFLVAGEAMAPAHPPGALRFAQPRPVAAGDDALIHVRAGAATEVHFCRIVAISDTMITGRCLNPRDETHFRRNTVAGIDKVLTVNELFGV